MINKINVIFAITVLLGIAIVCIAIFFILFQKINHNHEVQILQDKINHLNVALSDTKKNLEKQKKIVDLSATDKQQLIKINSELIKINSESKNRFSEIQSAYNPNKINLDYKTKKIELDNKSIYNLKTYKLHFPNYYNWKGKPTAYIEQFKENIIIVSGNGVFYFFNKNDFTQNIINLKKIESNFHDIVKNDIFYLPGELSTKDLLVIKNSIYVSYTKEQKNNCYNTAILKSDLNEEFLNFTEFFSYEYCQPKIKKGNFYINWKGHHAGGRMVQYKNNKILLTIGDYGFRPISQDINHLHGKIIAIESQNNYELISLGHRNPQGLYYDQKQDIIISTDHGPQGGDEININYNLNDNIVENYGWPISSYGEHYDRKFREEAPLHKSHIRYGFIEPIKYYTPSIAISEIIKIPKTFNKKFTNDFFIVSLGNDIKHGDMSIHYLRFDESYNKIIFEKIIPIKERIRDLLFLENSNTVILILENTPGIAVLENSIKN